ncbi:22366_t:CDS:2, partial [Gigaspora rosea]
LSSSESSSHLSESPSSGLYPIAWPESITVKYLTQIVDYFDQNQDQFKGYNKYPFSACSALSCLKLFVTMQTLMLSLQTIKSFQCLDGCSTSALRFSTMIYLVEKFRNVFLYILSKFFVGIFKIRFRILQFVNGSY